MLGAQRIIKRTGEVVPFDGGRIRNAILKAVRATKSAVDEAAVDELVEPIQREIQLRFVEFFPTSRTSRTSSRSTWSEPGTTRSPRPTFSIAPSAPGRASRNAPETVAKAHLGKLTVVAPDGRSLLFNFRKVEDVVRASCDGFDTEVPAQNVAREVAKSVDHGISTEEIGKALVMAASTFIERDPAYAYVTARLLLRRLYRETFGLSMLL